MDTSDFESNPRGLISVIQQLNAAVGNLAKLMKHDAPMEQTINVLSLNTSIQDMLPTILSNLVLEGAIDVKSSALQKQIKGLDKGLSIGDTAKTIIDI